MSTNPADNDLIERYLLGKLTGEESRAFQARLEKDREFARKFRLISAFPEMMSEPARIEFENKQADLVATVVKKKSVSRRNKRYFLWTAFIIAALTGAILFFIFSKADHQNDQIVHKESMVSKEAVVKTAVAPVRDPFQTKPIPIPIKVEKPKVEVEKGSFQKAINLLTPADGMTFSRKEEILFNWTMRTDSFTRFYVFSRNNDKLILWRGIRPGIREYKIPVNYLYPGKFYWYVGNKSQQSSFVIHE
jgi:hypothetical protein